MKLLRAYIREAVEPMRVQARTKDDKEMLREYLRYRSAFKDTQAKLAEIKGGLQGQFEEHLKISGSITVKPTKIEKKVEAWFVKHMGELEEGLNAILEATVRIDGVLIKLKKFRKKGTPAYKQILTDIVEGLPPDALEIVASIQDKHEEIIGAGKEKMALDVVEEGVMDIIKSMLAGIGRWIGSLVGKTNRVATQMNALADRVEAAAPT